VLFVLVGGLAAQAHGASRATQDAYICPEWTTENLGHLAASLTELDARLKIGEGSIDTLEIAIDARTLPCVPVCACLCVPVCACFGSGKQAGRLARVRRPRMFAVTARAHGQPLERDLVTAREESSSRMDA
jgi:hypothetical protein